jgi:hypothetical protein
VPILIQSKTGSSNTKGKAPHSPKAIKREPSMGWPSFFINKTKLMTGPTPNNIYPGKIHDRISSPSTYPNTSIAQWTSGLGLRFLIASSAKNQHTIAINPAATSHTAEQMIPKSFHLFLVMTFPLLDLIKQYLLSF